MPTGGLSNLNRKFGHSHRMQSFRSNIHLFTPSQMLAMFCSLPFRVRHWKDWSFWTWPSQRSSVSNLHSSNKEPVLQPNNPLLTSLLQMCWLYPSATIYYELLVDISGIQLEVDKIVCQRTQGLDSIFQFKQKTRTIIFILSPWITRVQTLHILKHDLIIRIRNRHAEGGHEFGQLVHDKLRFVCIRQSRPEICTTKML